MLGCFYLKDETSDHEIHNKQQLLLQLKKVSTTISNTEVPAADI
jgi:hypothetical protein